MNEIEYCNTMINKAIFLDRDGTVNVDKDYLFRIEEFEFLPGVIDALGLLQNAGYLLIIITNQSGIARGYYKESDFHKINDWMLEELRAHDIKISAVYYCPHHPKAKIECYRIDCECRKPKLGLFRQAIKDFKLDLSSCFAIGDKIRDCAICEETECKGFLIANNENKNLIESVKTGEIKNVRYAKDLFEAAKMIVGN